MLEVVFFSHEFASPAAKGLREGKFTRVIQKKASAPISILRDCELGNYKETSLSLMGGGICFQGLK